MLQVKSYEVYGLERAVKASGLPMSVGPDNVAYSDKRAGVLGNAKAGSGHDCFLKGIVVEARIKYPLYWTKQFQRYHFADIVSSQSTMHRVTKFDIGEQCNEWVDQRVIDIVTEYVELYNQMEDTDRVFISDTSSCAEESIDFIIVKEGELVRGPGKYMTKKDVFMAITSNLPSGFEMEMEIVTNYLQLKTIYQQRRYHKLPDWHVFCEWIESLPNFKEFCLKGEDK